MPPLGSEQFSRTIETLYRSESGRVLATLVRLLGDLDLAEEAMHEAFAVALESWPIQPSPVVQLNRAVAIAMRDGPETGLKDIDAVLEHGDLANYYLAHSARAELCRRLGRTAEARASYEKALALTQQEPERQFLQERIRQLK
jgi:predicted RNA polymerase sigma factor